ncbi:hypothetical protein NC994_19780 [Trichocoleus sp. AS-A1]|uniref:hypothetical protein n=1 Tax=Trichocoleus sp. AS-A2 TaxID=2933922 RepID=UPI0032969601
MSERDRVSHYGCGNNLDGVVGVVQAKFKGCDRIFLSFSLYGMDEYEQLLP